MKKLLLILAVSLQLFGFAWAVSTRPNIVFIYADDWGWGDLSCHETEWVETPNLDRLASQGTDFLQFNVLNPICSPSRVAAMTGRYSSRFGINDIFSGGSKMKERPDWLDPTAPNIAHYFKDAGYYTGHIGKWHMGRHSIPGAPVVADYGFDESRVYAGPGPQLHYEEIGDYAAKFIEENKDRPFYLNVWLHETHLPHEPSDASMKHFEHLDEQKQVYAAVLKDGDNKVGQVMDALDKAGIAENTIVVFSSDNGPEAPGNEKRKSRTRNGKTDKYVSYYSVGTTGGLRGGKRSLFEGGVRVPFIVRWPAELPAGVVNRKTVFTAVDLLPTFCGAAGIKLPKNAELDGEKLFRAFRGRQMVRSRPIFWLKKDHEGEPDLWPRLAVREGDWKLVTTFEGDRVELYNMVDNCFEEVSQEKSKENSEVVARLKQMVFDWYAELPTEPDPACMSKTYRNKEKKAK
ncbi:sulfatase-like hydrolase/transferase [Puniceicoccaceae bacterium]|nr:sulfatase-like hydrolase/transferase [Puniceicoccaceae bacterium]